VEQGLITGKLTGFNCWGAEKVNRLLNALGPKSSFYLYAYGDSEGDQALLNLADQAFFRIF
jgi:phosphoserine phosphatase